MGTNNRDITYSALGGEVPVKTHYKAIVETLNTLLDLGVIELPELSKQWKGHINAALKGDTFLLTQAMERWEKTIDPLLNLTKSGDYIMKWKQSEIDYILRVHKILTFYKLVTTLAEG